MTHKQILQELNASYERLRSQDHAEEERRRDEAVRRIPQLGEVLNARQDLVYSSLRGILSGNANADDLPRKMGELNDRVARLLTQAGYATDWLDPVYRCPKCRDTGYTGEPVREMCSCMRSAYYERLYAAVGLANSGHESFETFDLTVFPEKQLPGFGCTQRALINVARMTCEKWVTDYPYPQKRDMVLSGKSGLGKTFLLHCMAKRLLENGVNVLIVSAYSYLDIARRAYFGKQDGSDSELQSLMEADVLILDDLGTEPFFENITIVQLFNLLNERQMAGRATIISTNLNEKELRERYTERVISRMLDKRSCTFIPFAGDDVRRL